MSERLDESIFGAATPEPRTRAAARDHQQQQDPERGRGGRRLLVLLITVGLIGGAGLLAVNFARPIIARFTATDDFPGPGSGVVTVTVESGDSGRAIGTTLAKAGVVKSSTAFVEAAAGDPRAASIQPGAYDLKLEMKASDALAMLLDPQNRTVPRVTVREGLWPSEVYAALSKATGVPVANYVAAAKDADAIGLPAGAKGKIEGFLFPSTYEFAPKATAVTQLKTMVAQAKKELDALGVEPRDYPRILTLASIAEAEARTASDRAKVVRAVLNRLKIDKPLELDSSVSFAVKRRSITTTDVERASKSPYNTYKVVGLPPGPIGNAGVSSLKAAVDPASGPWLYWVAVNPQTGETKFATTFADHSRNVALFQQWCQENKGQC